VDDAVAGVLEVDDDGNCGPGVADVDETGGRTVDVVVVDVVELDDDGNCGPGVVGLIKGVVVVVVAVVVVVVIVMAVDVLVVEVDVELAKNSKRSHQQASHCIPKYLTDHRAGETLYDRANII